MTNHARMASGWVFGADGDPGDADDDPGDADGDPGDADDDPGNDDDDPGDADDDPGGADDDPGNADDDPGSVAYNFKQQFDTIMVNGGNEMSRKIAPVCVAVAIAFALILAGCNLFSAQTPAGSNDDSVKTPAINDDDADGYTKNPPPPEHAVGEIPGSGGEIQGSGKTAEYTFAPDKTGMWIVTLETSGDVSSVYLVVSDQSDDSALHSVYSEGKDDVFLFDSGNVYTINFEILLYTVGVDYDFSLSVSQPVEFPGGFGDTPFSDFSSLFTFTPDKSGEWAFSAYDITGSAIVPSTMASMSIRNTGFESISNETIYIDEGEEDVSVTVSADLDAGTEYIVTVSLYSWAASCNLEVSFTG